MFFSPYITLKNKILLTNSFPRLIAVLDKISAMHVVPSSCDRTGTDFPVMKTVFLWDFRRYQRLRIYASWYH